MLLIEKFWIFLLTIKKMIGQVLFCMGYFAAPPFAVAYFVFDASLEDALLISGPGVIFMLLIYVWFFDTYEKIMEEKNRI